MYDLPDLVFPLVMEHAGLFIEAVSLVRQQSMDHVIPGLSKGAGTFEHIVDAALFDLSFQLRSIHLSRRTVLGDILDKLSSLRQFRQQPHGNDTFSGPRPARAYDCALLMIFHGSGGELDDLFIHDTLLIDHDEFFIPLDHGSDGILKAL